MISIFLHQIKKMKFNCTIIRDSVFCNWKKDLYIEYAQAVIMGQGIITSYHIKGPPTQGGRRKQAYKDIIKARNKTNDVEMNVWIRRRLLSHPQLAPPFPFLTKCEDNTSYLIHHVKVTLTTKDIVIVHDLPNLVDSLCFSFWCVF